MASENPQKKAKGTRAKSKKIIDRRVKIKKVYTCYSSGHELPRTRSILYQSNILYSIPGARNDDIFSIVKLKFIS